MHIYIHLVLFETREQIVMSLPERNGVSVVDGGRVEEEVKCCEEDDGPVRRGEKVYVDNVCNEVEHTTVLK